MFSFLRKLFRRKPPAYLEQTVDYKTEWVNARGDKLKINLMTLPHLQNTVRLLLRKAGADMVLQLVEVLRGKIKQPSRFAQDYVITVMDQYGYHIANFTHPSFEYLLAEYLRRFPPHLRPYIAEKINEYSADVVIKAVQRTQEIVIQNSQAAAMEEAAEKLGVTVEELREAERVFNLGAKFFADALAREDEVEPS